MSDLRKAAEMALEALNSQTPLNHREFELRNSAIEALRQALAQPDQSPLVWMNKYGHVASFQNEEYKDPLYTEPPKREWIGLTRDEIDYCFEQCVIRKFNEDGTEESIVSIYKVVETVEAELKEKNI